MAHLHKPVKMSGAQIMAAIARNDPGAFTEMLTLVLGAEPSDEAYRKLANQDPLRWALAVKALARLAGY